LALILSATFAGAAPKSPWPQGLEPYQRSAGNCAVAPVERKPEPPASPPRTEEICRTEKLRAQLEMAPEALCPGVAAKSIDVCFDRVLGAMIDRKLLGPKSVPMLARAPLLWWFGRENPDTAASAKKLIDIDRAALKNYERVVAYARATPDEKLFPHFILHHWQEQRAHARELDAIRDEASDRALAAARKRWGFVGHEESP
jgi:hypothetical protein